MARRFANLDPAHRPPDVPALFRWAIADRVLLRRRVQPPGQPAPRVAPEIHKIHNPGDRLQLTWIGHASFLLSAGGRHFLIDPVFSRRIGLRYRRHVPPGILPEQLPPIDAVLISHNHYDHLDARSLRRLPRQTQIVAPLGLGPFFRRQRFSRVVELDWWQSTQFAGSRARLVPARHWSRRRMFDTNQTLWGGFVVESNGAAVYHAGDTAWFDGFAEIGRRFPHLAAAILPIGSYDPAWFMDRNHMNPEQAYQAFLDTGAQQLIPMHWGTFQMTDEPLTEPIERLKTWWQTKKPTANQQLKIPAIGETLIIDP